LVERAGPDIVASGDVVAAWNNHVFEVAMERLNGKTAIVTGAANGIGFAIAHRFAEEGASVLLCDINAAEAEASAARIRCTGARVETFVGDITEAGAAESMAQAAADSFGGIDVLVNNVGGARQGKIWEMSVEDWDFVIRLNLRTTFLCTRFVTPHMIKKRAGRVICLSSGAREGTPWMALHGGGSAYSTAKAGVHGFVRDVAMELAEFDITVNAIAPGPVDTDRVGATLRQLDKTVELSPSKLTPLGRLALPEEIAAAAVFLASDEASYVTGHTLAVAGGR
jgi:NAD(P)-dependent dehydrogenase (short-subunit alcohol dehydrogenase family)